jgi:hypothetical protein
MAVKIFPEPGADALRGLVTLERVTWQKPGIVEVTVSRLTADILDTSISMSDVVRCVDAVLLGALDEIKTEIFEAGIWRVFYIFKKFQKYGTGDDRKFSLAAGVERLDLRLHPFIDSIKKKYGGWENPQTRQIIFPSVLRKQTLNQRPSVNHFGDPWTGSDWPELSDSPGLIKNPFHGVRYFLAPYSEITIERAGAGALDWAELQRELGKAWPLPNDTGFSFLARGARGFRTTTSDGGRGRVAGGAKWVVVAKSMRRQGGDFSESTTWRSRVDPGFPRPVYD